MIALLNVLPALILLVGVAISVKLRKAWPLLPMALVLGLYMLLQPSYLPKGEVTRTTPPPFAPSNATVEDRLSKPVPGDVRDQRMKDAVERGLDFKP